MGLLEIDRAEFDSLSPQWDALAERAGSPFLTAAWFGAWWDAYAPDGGTALVMRDGDGSLLAGACFRAAARDLRPMANAHTSDWGAVAADADSARRFWAEVAARSGRRLVLERLPLQPDLVSPARESIESSGFSVVAEPGEASPWMELPGSLEELLAARSRNLRSQVGRRQRALEKEGKLEFRTIRDEGELDGVLDEFLRLEAAGWKGDAGTAILADRATETMYRSFAIAAARQGLLRMYVLELDGRLIAGDYACVYDGCGYLIKTAFDEEMGRYAPGLVLRAEVLRASIDEGLKRYDFLGGPDSYKLRWTEELRERVTLRAFRGPSSVPARIWWSAARPALKRMHNAVRRRTAAN
jgi:CelD/BcsL family acetyltransferase involved in cellulose biosynthesis